MTGTKGPRGKLFLMMVMEFFIWGAWLPLIFSYLPSLGFTPIQLAWVLNAFPLAAIVGMFFSNQFADRHFAAEKFLSFSHLVGGLAILGLGFTREFWPFFALMLVHCLFYVPTISIANSIAFTHMKDAQKEFGFVRMGGTIGWILAAWPFTFILVDWARWPSRTPSASGRASSRSSTSSSRSGRTSSAAATASRSTTRCSSGTCSSSRATASRRGSSPRAVSSATALRPAKIGLLDYMLGTAREPGFAERMYVVPVAINYDRVLEARALLRELRTHEGAPRASRLAQFREVLNYAASNFGRLSTRRFKRYGRAAVVVGGPVPVAPWLAGLAAEGAPLFERARAERLEAVQDFTDRMMGRIGAIIPVTAVPLVCAALQTFDAEYVPAPRLLAQRSLSHPLP